MPSIDLRQAGRELAKRTRREQGLPEYIEDEATLARIVTLLGLGAPTSRPRGDAA
jgi:hypothetical protein